jgi:hypothetical protein
MEPGGGAYIGLLSRERGCRLRAAWRARRGIGLGLGGLRVEVALIEGVGSLHSGAPG